MGPSGPRGPCVLGIADEVPPFGDGQRVGLQRLHFVGHGLHGIARREQVSSFSCRAPVILSREAGVEGYSVMRGIFGFPAAKSAVGRGISRGRPFGRIFFPRPAGLGIAGEAMRGCAMAGPEHCSIEHLAAVFAESREEIIEEWRQQAGKLLEDLRLDRATLTDHVPSIVDGIIRDLSQRREGEAHPQQPAGHQPQHGFQRVADGLEVGEVVEEFNLLRAAFFTVVGRHELYLVGEAARIINRRIDRDVRLAVTAFAQETAALLKAREAEHLAFIAHDLRTPLNAISLLVDELQFFQGADAAGAGEIFALLKSNVRQLDSLIRGVLRTAGPAPELGETIHLERRTFELWPLVQRLVLDLGAVSAKDGITVTNEVPRQLAITADAGLVSRVFQNLLGNAFKYSAHGRVTISARTAGREVHCTVRDTGEGIPPEMLGRVFDKHITDHSKPGTGLGLAIVKQIVAAHGGQVRVESSLGNGARFHFTLPAAAAP